MCKHKLVFDPEFSTDYHMVFYCERCTAIAAYDRNYVRLLLRGVPYIHAFVRAQMRSLIDGELKKMGITPDDIDRILKENAIS